MFLCAFSFLFFFYIEANAKVKIQNIVLVQVEELKYLLSIIHSHGQCVKEVKLGYSQGGLRGYIRKSEEED